MKKYSFLVYHREYEKFLLDLQDLGVLHIIEKESGEIENDELKQKYALTKQLEDSIKFLDKRNVEKRDDSGEKNGLQVLDELNDLREDKEHYLQKLTSLKKELSLIEPWGEFKWESIERLKKQGILTRFLTCPSKKYEDEIKDNYFVEIINQISGNVYFVLIEKANEKTDIDVEEINLPGKSLSQIQTDIQNIEKILDKTENLFDKFARKYIPMLQKLFDRLTAELSFENVVLNTTKEADDKLMILEGWAPKDKEEELIHYLDNSGLYYESAAPDGTMMPPIKLKNNKFVKLYEAIGELYTFPDYKELDLTPFFAPFYMLFFGFCLGDAGYGLLITIGTIYGLFKVKKKLKPLLKLGMYLGIATTIMGAVGGTLFGINLIDTGYKLTSNSIEILKNEVPEEIHGNLISLQDQQFDKKIEFEKKIEETLGKDKTSEYKTVIIKSSESKYSFLNSFRHLFLDSDMLMILALLLGYIQVLFGMFINAANKARMFGFKHSISQLGWNVIVMIAIPVYALGMFGVFAEETANKIALIALITGGLPALFYNSPGKNPFLNLGVGLWDTYQTASGLLGDVLSYIRLFALGISSAILGSVFNDLALQSMHGLNDSIIGIIFMIIILAFGHSLNFFMAALGSFVHPLRLTFVEFYKNAGFVGGGKKYNPFSR